jgi:hypothetical protein
VLRFFEYAAPVFELRNFVFLCLEPRGFTGGEFFPVPAFLPVLRIGFEYLAILCVSC